MVSGVITDDVDHGNTRLAGVVQVGHAIAQSAAQVQQGGGRLASHPRVAVGRPRGHPLEQGENATHVAAVEGVDEVHLRGAGVAKAGVDAGVEQGLE